MARLKAPFLSLQARGSVGNSLTTSRHPSGTVAKLIPSHPDAQTLPQLYQRWRFYDANQYWNSLSQSQRNAYRDLKYPPHLTPQQKCIRAYLRNPLDQVLWLRLDTRTGLTAIDSSKKANHGLITGATPIPGFIDYSRSFDGIDDQIAFSYSPTLQNFTTKTVSLWVYTAPFTGAWRPVYNANFWHPNYGDRFYLYPNANEWGFAFRNTIAYERSLTGVFTPNRWNHFAYTWDGTTARSYLNSLFTGQHPLAGTLECLTTGTYIARGRYPTDHGTAPPDDIRIYTRALTPAHIAYIFSQERFPLPD